MASQTEIDTARAKSRQNGGDGGTSERMSQREAAAGLNLAGNDPMSGRGQLMPTMSEREAAAGLNLAGNKTLSSIDDSFYNFDNQVPERENPSSQVLYGDDAPMQAAGGGGSSGGGGGGGTFTLDVVKDDNTAGTATFNGSGVN